MNVGKWLRLAGAGALGGLFAAGVAMVLALPLWQYLGLSTRAGLNGVEQAALSLPARGLIGIIFPQMGAYAEWVTSPGVVVLLLAILGCLLSTPGWMFWALVGVCSLLLSMGDQTPIYGLLARFMPGMQFLRVPARMLFLWNLSIAVLAGSGLNRLLRGEFASSQLRRIRLGTIGVLGLIVVLGVVISLDIGQQDFQGLGLVGGLLVIAIMAVVWTSLTLARRQPAGVLVVGWCLLVAADVAWIDSSLLEARSLDSSLSVGGEVAEWVALRNDQRMRVFSPSYSVPQQTAAMTWIELADGVNPMQLAAYRGFMASATGFADQSYGVTLPPFPTGNPSEDWKPSLAGDQLGLLSVGWVVSAYPLEGDDLQLEAQVGGDYVYSNAGARPRAWVESSDPATNAGWRPAGNVTWEPNRVSVDATGPGLLVLSEVAYPGWSTLVDGEYVESTVAYKILRAAQLPSGHHHVEFVFRPWTVFLGAGITGLSLLGVILLRLRR